MKLALILAVTLALSASAMAQRAPAQEIEPAQVALGQTVMKLTEDNVTYLSQIVALQREVAALKAAAARTKDAAVGEAPRASGAPTAN